MDFQKKKAYRIWNMKRCAGYLIDIVVWVLGKGIYVIFYLLGWSFIYRVGKITGYVIYFLSSKQRKTTKQEIALLFENRLSREKINEIAKRSFENYYKRQIETILFGHLKKGHLEKMIDAEGLENIDNALSKGKGIIMLLSHFGSFLLPLPFLGYRGYRVHQITGKQNHTSLISERIWQWRSREAAKLPVSFKQVDSFLRPIYQALKNNEIVAVAFDGRDSTQWIAVEFFGRKAWFSTGPFELARRTGAAVIPTFVIRKKDDTHRIIFESEFNLSEDNNMDIMLERDTKKFADIFARYITEYPCHFGMVLYKLKMAAEAKTGKPLWVVGN